MIQTDGNSLSAQNATDSTREKKMNIFENVVDYDLSENFAPLQPMRKSVDEKNNTKDGKSVAEEKPVEVTRMNSVKMKSNELKEGRSFQKKEIHMSIPEREYQILKIISIVYGKSIIQLLLENLTVEFREKMKNFESYI